MNPIILIAGAGLLFLLSKKKSSPKPQTKLQENFNQEIETENPDENSDESGEEIPEEKIYEIGPIKPIIYEMSIPKKKPWEQTKPK